MTTLARTNSSRLHFAQHRLLCNWGWHSFEFCVVRTSCMSASMSCSFSCWRNISPLSGSRKTRFSLAVSKMDLGDLLGSSAPTSPAATHRASSALKHASASASGLVRRCGRGCCGCCVCGCGGVCAGGCVGCCGSSTLGNLGCSAGEIFFSAISILDLDSMATGEPRSTKNKCRRLRTAKYLTKCTLRGPVYYQVCGRGASPRARIYGRL